MATPAKPGYSGGLASTLARDNALQVKGPDGKWVFVRGLSKISPKFQGSMQDDTDIDGEGYKSQISTAIQFTIETEGKRKGTFSQDKFVQDPGQVILREAGEHMGYQNVIQARTWRTDGVDQAYEAAFTVEYSTGDGGIEDLDTFTATLMSRGKPNRIQVVTDPEADSVLYGVQPGGNLNPGNQPNQPQPANPAPVQPPAPNPGPVTPGPGTPGNQPAPPQPATEVESKKRIAVPNDATGGTWALTLNGKTVEYEYNATPTTFRVKLQQAVPELRDVIVRRYGTYGFELEATTDSAIAISADGSKLTGAASNAIAITDF